MVFSFAGSGLMWLSSHSIPVAIRDADSDIVTNLKWLGWKDPPTALASKTADNIGMVLGALLVVAALIVLAMYALEKHQQAKVKAPASYISPREAIHI